MKRSLSLVLIILAVLLSVVVEGAAQDYVDVVYLKNGGVIRGLIIEQIPGKSIKIQTEGGNIFVFTYEEIEKITKEESVSRYGTWSKTGPKKPGEYLNITKIGIMSGEGEDAILSAAVINGFLAAEPFSCGVGIGYDKYPNGSMMPIFVEGRVYPIQSQVQPTFFLDAGHSLGWIKGLNGSDWGGFMLNIGVGIRVNLARSKAAFLMDAGYKHQEAKEWVYYWGYYWGYEETIKVKYDFFTIQAGILF